MLLSIFLFCSLLFIPQDAEQDIPPAIYDFKVEALTGATINFSKYKGKKILIVNTASECGYTPQYEGLEALYRKYKNKLVIVGFPCNDFGAQEPGSNEDIAAFCRENYKVTFPMAAKISVKGVNIEPIYQWLTNEKYNHFQSSEVKWNFQKYLIDEKGNLVQVFSHKIKPDSDEIRAAIEK